MGQAMSSVEVEQERATQAGASARLHITVDRSGTDVHLTQVTSTTTQGHSSNALSHNKALQTLLTLGCNIPTFMLGLQQHLLNYYM